MDDTATQIYYVYANTFANITEYANHCHTFQQVAGVHYAWMHAALSILNCFKFTHLYVQFYLAKLLHVQQYASCCIADNTSVCFA